MVTTAQGLGVSVQVGVGVSVFVGVEVGVEVKVEVFKGIEVEVGVFVVVEVGVEVKVEVFKRVGTLVRTGVEKKTGVEEAIDPESVGPTGERATCLEQAQGKRVKAEKTTIFLIPFRWFIDADSLFHIRNRESIFDAKIGPDFKGFLGGSLSSTAPRKAASS